MVDLDSDPTKLIEIVEIGKQLLMTRGALTTFSIANDVAKYFAILPAMFVATAYPAMGSAQHHAPVDAAERDSLGGDLQRADHRRADSAGLARRRYGPQGANAVLFENVMLYGVGGIIVPFIGIKLIDMILAALHLT